MNRNSTPEWKWFLKKTHLCFCVLFREDKIGFGLHTLYCIAPFTTKLPTCPIMREKGTVLSVWSRFCLSFKCVLTFNREFNVENYKMYLLNMDYRVKCAYQKLKKWDRQMKRQMTLSGTFTLNNNSSLGLSNDHYWVSNWATQFRSNT